jgi:hypothetical protein
MNTKKYQFLWNCLSRPLHGNETALVGADKAEQLPWSLIAQWLARLRAYALAYGQQCLYRKISSRWNKIDRDRQVRIAHGHGAALGERR